MNDVENFIVVAVPQDGNIAWRASSEDVPHLTILYLAVLEDPEKMDLIVKHIEHVVRSTQMRQFDLTVDKRGTLGPDGADVLFFDKHFGNEQLVEFREECLKNQYVREAFDRTKQFPKWTPHLTLGYPTNPAILPDRDLDDIHWVRFDTISVWTEQYSGYDIHLNDGFEVDMKFDPLFDVTESVKVDNDTIVQDEEQKGEPTTDMAQDEQDLYFLAHFGEGATQVLRHEEDLDFLEHFGVKGMRWGVRKDERGPRIDRIAPKRRTANQLFDAGDDRGIVNKAKTLASLQVGGGVGNTVGLAAGYVAFAHSLKALAPKIGYTAMEPMFNPALAPFQVATAKAAAYAMTESQAQATMIAAASSLGVATVVSAAVTYPTMMAIKAVARPISTAYSSSKSEIRRNVKALNKSGESDQKTYNDAYKKIVTDAMNRQKSAFTNPFRKIAQVSAGKNASSEYRIDFNMSPPEGKKPFMNVIGPNGRSQTVNLGRIKHADIAANEVVFGHFELEFVTDKAGKIVDFYSPQLEMMAAFENVPDDFFDKKEETLEQDDFIDDYLEHFGVKGMRWGVRKPVDTETGLIKGSKHADAPPPSRKEGSADHERMVNSMVKKTEEGNNSMLSDREIKELTNRINAERSLNTLLEITSPVERELKEIKAAREISKINAEIAYENRSGATKLASLLASKGGELLMDQAGSFAKEYGADYIASALGIKKPVSLADKLKDAQTNLALKKVKADEFDFDQSRGEKIKEAQGSSAAKLESARLREAVFAPKREAQAAADKRTADIARSRSEDARARVARAAEVRKAAEKSASSVEKQNKILDGILAQPRHKSTDSSTSGLLKELMGKSSGGKRKK